MTRSRATQWFGCAVVTLVATGQMASSQSLKPDAHGFLIAAPAFWLFTKLLGINLPGLTQTGWL